VNFSNHPSSHWSETQLAAAAHYGEVRDLPFPSVEPALDENEILLLAERCAGAILRLDPAAVMCQGEFSLCFAVTQLLQQKGVTVLCACSERKAEEYVNEDGSAGKRVEFSFVRFRRYSVKAR